VPAKSLQSLVDYARRNSPFYAELYRDVPQVISDITQLPVVDQDEFWAANTFPDNRLLTGPLTDASVFKTGGTTGAPKFSAWSHLEHVEAVRTFGAGMARAGVRSGHRVANLFFAGELYSGFIFINDALLHAPVDNVRLPIGGSTSAEFVAGVIAEFGVNVLCGNPSSFVMVADLLAERGEVADSVELLLFGGEALFDDLRPVLARGFPKAAIGSVGYASVDAGLIGAPVPGDDVRVHEAFDPYIRVELVDEATGEPITAPGVPGRLIATNMFRTLMPTIRYPVGDRAEWIDPGRQRFRLIGRSGEGALVGPAQLRTEDARTVINGVDRDRVVTGMQLVARRWDGRDGLILRLAADVPPPADLGRAIVDAVYAARPLFPESIEQNIIHPLTVEWVRRSELATNPRTGKLIAVVDERPRS
jgi:phenylacetate-coenzyme A ligase PaaK-like adenylate-forming protein